MTENIFLSYRRDDSRGYTNAIYTVLEYHFDSDQIFMDVDTLIPGSNFVQSLEDAVEACDIFLAIIGLRWESIEDKKGVRRLENPEDFVRIEVAHALKRGIPVIPVLVDGAEMPSSENLPDNLKDLAYRHAFSIGDHMRSDVQRLIKVLEKTFERLERERVEQEQKESELSAKQEAEQKAKAQAEADLKEKEQAETEKKAAEEKEQLALQKAELERQEQEKIEADRKAREQAGADLKAKEQAEADRKVREKADQKAMAQAEADRQAVEKKAKREADKKAKIKAKADRKAQQVEKAGSSAPSALKKIPVWVWPVAGVVLTLIGYGLFGGLSPTSPEEPGETEVSLAVADYTNSPTSEAISSTPIPEATIIPTAVLTAVPIVEPPAGAEISNLKDGAVMVYVPSGDFIMGSDNGESNESPAHSVYLDGFWIYKTEMTNAMYTLCVEAGGCIHNDWQLDITDLTYANHPVVGISWKQADTYCRWAESQLPTEAEWEKAARGTDGRMYPWGEDFIISYANYADTYHDPGGEGTVKVGSYPEGASPYGVLDMAGNVTEYVADWYAAGYYAISQYENPAGPEDGLERVVRGGSFNNSSSNLVVTKRSSIFPREIQTNQFGFRCAISYLP